jgi:5-methylthioribose kinase
VLEVTADNVLDYLRATARLSPDASARAALLAGGVSNVVLRVSTAGAPDFVLKQSCEKLRTRADWRSRLDRIWREVAVLRLLERLLPAGAVPRVLFEDRPNFLFAMSAVDPGHVVWKEALLRGEVDLTLADRLGEYLARIHAGTFADPVVHAELADVTVFDELRIDPYYRHIAAVHLDLAEQVRSLIDAMLAARLCLVLADFSPKNILLTPGHVTLVDFETGHFGDPGFDLGFFLTHLALKAVRRGPDGGVLLELARRFLHAYQVHAAWPADTADRLEARSVQHWAACLLARVDGKSPVEYLDTAQQDRVRRLARGLLLQPPRRLENVLDALTQTCGAGSD